MDQFIELLLSEENKDCSTFFGSDTHTSNTNKTLDQFFLEDYEDPNKTLTEISDKDGILFKVIRTDQHKANYIRWSKHEHNLFLSALIATGNDWKLASKHIATRSAVQIRSHAQKFFMKLKKKYEKQNKDSNYLKELIRFEFANSLHLIQSHKDNEEKFYSRMSLMVFSLGRFPKKTKIN